MYIQGKGVKEDLSKARGFFAKACHGGDAKGCSNLGFMYVNGQGVKQDYSKAKELFSKACDEGDADGCKSFALLKRRE